MSFRCCARKQEPYTKQWNKHTLTLLQNLEERGRKDVWSVRNRSFVRSFVCVCDSEAIENTVIWLLLMTASAAANYIAWVDLYEDSEYNPS